MAIEVSQTAALRRRVDLQERLWQASHRRVGKSVSAIQLYREIRGYLIKASDQKLINESQKSIHQALLFFGPNRKGYFDIAVGRTRNFNRTKDLPHFTRRDGGWFDFQLQVEEKGTQAEILAYDFELRLPEGNGIDFVRFDLNPPGHENEEHGLRSHFHLNADDDGLAAPAPVMSPFEILDLFLHGLCRTGRIRSAPVTQG